MNNYDKLKELVETDTDFSDFISDSVILKSIYCLQEYVLNDDFRRLLKETVEKGGEILKK